MHTCPNCTSQAIGSELISACSSCGELAVAGASMPIAAIIAAAVITAAGFLAARAIKSLQRGSARLA